MNSIVSIESIDIDSLSQDQIELLQSRLVAKQLQFLNQEVKLVKEEQIAQRAEIEIVKAEQQKTVEVAANSLRVQNGYDSYISQGDFGRFFSVSISSVDLGKLLKAVGLAMKGKGRTTPYREYVPKYAKTVAKESYTEIKWHYVNCMEFIDKWLKKNDKYERFYSLQTEDDMKQFINQIYGEMM